MPLRLRIALIIFLIGSGITVLTTWQAVSSSLEASRPQLTRNESVLLEMLQEISVNAALTGEFIELAPFMERLGQDPDILLAVLVDQDDRVVISTNKDLVGTPSPARTDSDTSYWRVRDIQAANERLGLLAVEFSTAGIDRLEQDAWLRGAVVVGAGVLASLILSILGSFAAVGRLVALNRITRDIANGNTLVSPVIPGNDEIGSLSISIQELVARIERSESERLSLSGGSDEAEQRLRALAEATYEPVIIKNADGRWDEANTASRELLRLDGLPWRGKTDEDLAILVPPLATFFRSIADADQQVISSQQPATTAMVVPDPMGEERHLAWSRIPFHDSSGRPNGLVMVGHDQTDEYSGRAHRIAEQARLQALLANVADAVVLSDAHGSVETINEQAQRLTGWTLEEIRDRPVSEALPLLDNETRRPLAEALRDAAREGAALAGGNPVTLLHRDGSETAVTARAAPISDDEGHVVGQLVTLQSGAGNIQAARGGSISGLTDPLTGLLNGRGFEQALQATLANPAQQHRHHFLLVIDLDDFNRINDKAGRFAADNLLRRLGQVIRECLRTVDPVGRLAADRFALLLENCTLEKAEFLAGKLRTEIEEFRLVWQDITIQTTACIGIVPTSAAAPLAVDWIKTAESTCFAAKEQGGNQIRWDSHAATRLSRQYQDRQWCNRVDLALKGDEFELFVQPARALKAGRPDYHELLLRLRDKDGKPVAASHFLPIAERAGLGLTIDKWVLAAVMRAWKAGRMPGDNSIWGINLSALTLDDNHFVEQLEAQLKEAGMPGERLCFEMKGSSLAQDLVKAHRLFDSLRALGCKVALDNIGARASTFACLKELEVDLVKLDGSLVSSMTNDPMSATLVEAIQKAATVQGVASIAKWVENPETLKRITQLGASWAQGHGVEPVQPLESFAQGKAESK